MKRAVKASHVTTQQPQRERPTTLWRVATTVSVSSSFTRHKNFGFVHVCGCFVAVLSYKKFSLNEVRVGGCFVAGAPLIRSSKSSYSHQELTRGLAMKRLQPSPTSARRRDYPSIQYSVNPSTDRAQCAPPSSSRWRRSGSSARGLGAQWACRATAANHGVTRTRSRWRSAPRATAIIAWRRRRSRE